MKSDMIWTLVAFAFYLAGMLLIGAAYMKKTKSSEDFFLGGRGLNGWVAALSAQASDMSGWMLMGLLFRQAESFSTLYSVSTTRYALLSVR